MSLDFNKYSLIKDGFAGIESSGFSLTIFFRKYKEWEADCLLHATVRWCLNDYGPVDPCADRTRAACYLEACPSAAGTKTKYIVLPRLQSKGKCIILGVIPTPLCQFCILQLCLAFNRR